MSIWESIGHAARGFVPTAMEIEQRKKQEAWRQQQAAESTRQWEAGNKRAEAQEADRAAEVKMKREREAARKQALAALGQTDAAINSLRAGTMKPEEFPGALANYSNFVKDGWVGAISPDGQGIVWSRSGAALPSSYESKDEFLKRASNPQTRQDMYLAAARDMAANGDAEGAALILQQANVAWGRHKDTHDMQAADRRDAREAKRFGYEYEDWNGHQGGLKGVEASQREFQNQTGRIGANATAGHYNWMHDRQNETDRLLGTMSTMVGPNQGATPRASENEIARRAQLPGLAMQMEGRVPGANFDRWVFPEQFQRGRSAGAAQGMSQADYIDSLKYVDEKLSGNARYQSLLASKSAEDQAAARLIYNETLASVVPFAHIKGGSDMRAGGNSPSYSTVGPPRAPGAPATQGATSQNDPRNGGLVRQQPGYRANPNNSPQERAANKYYGLPEDFDRQYSPIGEYFDGLGQQWQDYKLLGDWARKPFPQKQRD